MGAAGMMLTCGAWAQDAASAAGEAAQSEAGGQVEVVPIPNHHDIYMLAGGGANIVVQTGADGTVVVNAGSAQASEQVLAAIKKLTAEPIRYVIDTSADADVVGGNGALSQAGRSIYFAGSAPIRFQGVVQRAATVMATAAATLRVGAPLGQTAPFPESDWPTQSIGVDDYYVYQNNEGVVLYHQPAQDDTDAIVHFRGSDVIAAGDVIDTDRFPIIDVKKGGSIQAEISALNRIIDLSDSPMPFVWAPGGTYIVPGHGRLYQPFDVVQYRDMLLEIEATVQDMIEHKMTLQQIEAASPCLSYQSQYGRDSGPWTTNDFVQAIYQSLTQQQKTGRKGHGA